MGCLHCTFFFFAKFLKVCHFSFKRWIAKMLLQRYSSESSDCFGLVFSKIKLGPQFKTFKVLALTFMKKFIQVHSSPPPAFFALFSFLFVFFVFWSKIWEESRRTIPSFFVQYMTEQIPKETKIKVCAGSRNLTRINLFFVAFSCYFNLFIYFTFVLEVNSKQKNKE